MAEAPSKTGDPQSAPVQALKPALVPASGSANPSVQHLLAEIGIAQQNKAARQSDKDEADRQIAGEQAVIDAKKAELEELGFSV